MAFETPSSVWKHKSKSLSKVNAVEEAPVSVLDLAFHCVSPEVFQKALGKPISGGMTTSSLLLLPHCFPSLCAVFLYSARSTAVTPSTVDPLPCERVSSRKDVLLSLWDRHMLKDFFSSLGL